MKVLLSFIAYSMWLLIIFFFQPELISPHDQVAITWLDSMIEEEGWLRICLHFTPLIGLELL
jgi:hypothetical protein